MTPSCCPPKNERITTYNDIRNHQFQQTSANPSGWSQPQMLVSYSTPSHPFIDRIFQQTIQRFWGTPMASWKPFNSRNLSHEKIPRKSPWNPSRWNFPGWATRWPSTASATATTAPACQHWPRYRSSAARGSGGSQGRAKGGMGVGDWRWFEQVKMGVLSIKTWG